MSIVNRETGTRVDEVSAQIYRISTPIPPGGPLPSGFSFNQFLLVDDEPLLFHTGMRSLFPLVRAAIETVIAVAKLRWISFGHLESDECGAFREFAAAAPNARLLCGQIQSLLAAADLSDRPPEVLIDGKSRKLGAHTVTWIDAPHVPHAWDNGFLFETSTRTLFGGDLFTQPGADNPPVTEGDILGPSEAMRSQLEYYSHTPSTRVVLEHLAALNPELIACMHGSAFRGAGAKLLRALADALESTRAAAVLSRPS
jgi:flavorubredoxin